MTFNEEVKCVFQDLRDVQSCCCVFQFVISERLCCVSETFALLAFGKL